MNNTKDRMIFEPQEKDQILMRNGKKYRFLKDTIKNGHIKELIYEEIDESEYEKQLDKIATYLIEKSGLDTKTVIKDILRQSSGSELSKLEKEVEKELSVEIVPGCLSLKIGKSVIEIVK